jgi:hypothetical protein
MFVVSILNESKYTVHETYASSLLITLQYTAGARGGAMVEALRYKAEGVPMVSLEFFIDIILPAAPRP